MERRFDQSDLYLIKEVEQLLLLSAANEESYSVFDNVVKNLEDYINMDYFKIHLSIWFQIVSRQRLKIQFL